MDDLQLTCDLECEFDGTPLRICANQHLISVDVPNVWSGFQILRSLSKLSDVRLVTFERRFIHLPFALEVRVKGRLIAAIGQAESGRLLRMLGFRKLRIQFWNLLKTKLKEMQSASNNNDHGDDLYAVDSSSRDVVDGRTDLVRSGCTLPALFKGR